MKFCAMCGKRLEDTCVFCIYCGARQPEKEGVSTMQTPVYTTIYAPSQPVMPPKPVESAQAPIPVNRTPSSGNSQAVKSKVFGWVGFGLGLTALINAVMALLFGALAHSDIDFYMQEQLAIYAMIYVFCNLPGAIAGLVFSNKSNLTMAERGRVFAFLSFGIGFFAFLIAMGAM